MKSFGWEDLLKNHLIFSSLSAEEIRQLLRDKVSQEREYSPGRVILKEGELGDSIFLIGLGSVQITRLDLGDQEVPLAILEKGEFFGEIAVLQRKPRSATVRARENCTLLEVQGKEFLKLLKEHSDIQSKIQAKMSQRSRPLSRK